MRIMKSYTWAVAIVLLACCMLQHVESTSESSSSAESSCEKIKSTKRPKATKKPKCTPIEQCVGVNEVLELCSNNCPSESCDDIASVITCVPVEPCCPACRCMTNYRRDTNGTCIAIQLCPPPTCTGANEEFMYCKGIGYSDVCGAPEVNDPVDGEPCNSGCFCTSGFCRDENNNCVENNVCPGAGEEYGPYDSLCGEITCESYVNDVVCVPFGPIITNCHCREGYYRSTGGICVTPDTCS